MAKAKRTNGAADRKAAVDHDASARRYIRDRLAAAPAEVRGLANELRSLILGCEVRAGCNGGADEALEQLRRMRRAHYRVRSEADLLARSVSFLAGVRAGGTGAAADVAAGIRVVRGSPHGGAFREWTDEQLERSFRAANFNRAVSVVLGELKRSVTESNVDRMVKGRHSSRKPAK